MAAREMFMSKRTTTWLAVTLLAAGLACTPPCLAQVSGWAGSSAPPAPSNMGRGPTTVMELFGQIGVQIGGVFDGSQASDVRSPLGIKPLVGLNFFEIKDTRILLGVTLAFPFSVEMGWGNDVNMFAFAPGVQVGRRECANWSWFAGVEIPIVVSPERIAGAATEVLGGIGLRGGAAWYFLSGFGIYGEGSLELYFGDSAAFVMGVTGGIVISWEMFRYTSASASMGGL
jgi:hypothetical protein